MGTDQYSLTTRLFPAPSFGRGMGSVFDLFGSWPAELNIDTDGHTADMLAARADVLAVAMDFRKAFEAARLRFEAATASDGTK